jgi:hypothetical protein
MRQGARWSGLGDSTILGFGEAPAGVGCGVALGRGSFELHSEPGALKSGKQFWWLPE